MYCSLQITFPRHWPRARLVKYAQDLCPCCESSNMRSLPMPVRFASELSSGSPNESDYELRLAKTLVDNGSSILKELLELQNKV